MKRDVRRLADEVFDVAVVGGGIHGAWIAWDATLRGLSVALVERGDFASQTSANNLKTIHGGLRYLQHGDIRRMRESINERSTLLRVAPHLVHPLPVIVPLYGGGIRGPMGMRAALALTDLIGIDENRGLPPGRRFPRGRVLSRRECLDRLPGLDATGLSGAALWQDAQVYDTERLVIAILRAAAERGSALANYVEAVGLTVRRGRVLGLDARDALTDDRFTIRSRVVVNAAGPWAIAFGDRHGATATGRRFHLSKAFNVAVPRFLERYAVGVSARSGRQQGARLYFMAPWRDLTLIGTVHLPFSGSPDQLAISEAEIAAFLRDVNAAYPAAGIGRSDVVYVQAGLLPTVGDRLPRGRVRVAEHALVLRDGRYAGPAGLITVTGVKYTTARRVASQAVDAVFEELGLAASRSTTAERPIHGGDIADSDIAPVPAGPASIAELPDSLWRQLHWSYGSKLDQVLDLARRDPQLSEPVGRSAVAIKAQVVYGVRQEMAMRLSDVIMRRTAIGTGSELSDEVIRTCAELMGKELLWSDAQLRAELKTLHRTFEPTAKGIADDSAVVLGTAVEVAD